MDQTGAARVRLPRIVLAAFCATAPAAARADALVHVKSQIYGCEKAIAARALNNPTNPRHSDPAWIAYVMGDGQCVKITPQSQWAVMGADENGVTLLSYRGTIGRPGSFYVPTASIDFAAADAPPATAPPLSGQTVPAPAQLAPGEAQQQPAAGGPPPAGAVPGPPQPSAGDATSAAGLSGGSTAAPEGPVTPSTTPAQAAAPVQPAPGATSSNPPPIDDKALADLKADIAKSDPSTRSMIWPVLLFLILIAMAGAAWFLIRRRKAGARARLWQHIEDAIESNAAALRIKRVQTVQRDEYGTLVFAKWEAAKQYYLDTRIMQLAAAQGFASLPAGFARLVDDAIESAAAGPAGERLPDVPANDFVSSPDAFDARMHPHDYEMFCAMELQHAGWDTRTTTASGDKGGDIIARQGGKTLVLQCKLDRSAIGPDAVQPVQAAKELQSAQFAAVVSNQPFTRAAKQFASINGITLLHHDELRTFRPGQTERARM
jgi:hypothetical protein